MCAHLSCPSLLKLAQVCLPRERCLDCVNGQSIPDVEQTAGFTGLEKAGLNLFRLLLMPSKLKLTDVMINRYNFSNSRAESNLWRHDR